MNTSTRKHNKREKDCWIVFFGSFVRVIYLVLIPFIPLTRVLRRVGSRLFEEISAVVCRSAYFAWNPSKKHLSARRRVRSGPGNQELGSSCLLKLSQGSQ